MKTMEELKSMTTEDLVRYAQELQENLSNKEKSSEAMNNMYFALKDRYETLRDSLKNLLKLTENGAGTY